MKADWDKLGDKYAKSPSVMIVDVDCTAGGQSTCQTHGVKGYPTIKYFINGKAKDYQGGRDYNSLAGFASKTLDIAKCDALTGKNCKPNEQKFIEKHQGMSSTEIAAVMKERDDKFKQTKKDFQAVQKEFKGKEKEYKKGEKAHKKTAGLLKTLQKAAAKKTKDEL